MKKVIISLVVLCVVALAFYFIKDWYSNRLYRNPDFAYGNGRIEATEINIAARLAGKVERVRVLEGDMVQANQPLVVMQVNVLVAQLAQAEAQRAQALAYKESAEAKIALQEATLKRMNSSLERSKAVVKNNEREYLRYKALFEKGSATRQEYDRHQTSWDTAKADYDSALASIKEAEANLWVAKADLAAAKANILAAEAEMARVKADIDDSVLRAPLAGRVQYRVAEPGEVLAAGGRALNMIDLTDVYMTFFLSEHDAGRVRVGNEVRIVLDIAPEYPLNAKITYVASVAQFTPKTVETKLERQKLMFRVKAHIDRAFLEDYLSSVKTGLPGVAWVKLNPSAEWPKQLQPTEAARKRLEEVHKALKANEEKNAKKVLESATAKNTAPLLKDEGKRSAAVKGASKEEQREVIVQAAKEVSAMKTEETEKTVEQAKASEKARASEVNKTVEKVVKGSNADQSTKPEKK